MLLLLLAAAALGGRMGKPFAKCTAPNNTWTADFKGQFRTKDQ